MSRPLTTVLVAALVVLAGCGGAGGGAGGDAGDAGPDGAEDADAGERPNDESASADADERAATDGDGRAGDERAGRPSQTRIRTGRMTVEVAAFDDARANLTRTADALGGYVSGGQRRTHRDGNRTWTNGTVQVRVPNENFTRMMDAARAAGVVRTSATNSTDVADRLVNIEGRLENLRSKRDRLRELYDGASRTEELLAIQERISETQGEIERLTARQAALEDRVAYATITVRLVEPKPPAPEAPADGTNASNASDGTAWDDRGPAAAFVASVDTIVTAARVAGVLVAYALPYALVVGLPAVVVVGLRRRRSPG